MTCNITWLGPFGWPKFEGDLSAIPKVSGVYLQTVNYLNGYLIYGAGITKRPVSTRLREHTRNYLNGEYTVLDIASMKEGRRVEIWHGWGWTPEKRADFDKRRQMILEAARSQIEGFRIFVADVGNESRIRERLEAGIMDQLYKQPPPLCDIPDRGMYLAPRRMSETPIIVTNECQAVLHGLPASFEI
jgi:hypothetical protein